MNNGIPHRNRSPHGWWVASYVLRAAWSGEPEPAPGSTHQVWENTIILQAPDREAAYEKAVWIASGDQAEFEDSSSPGRHGRWVFEGLSRLLPIYDELGDGAEILWQEHSAVPYEKIRSWVRAKSRLQVFDDTPAPGDPT